MMEPRSNSLKRHYKQVAAAVASGVVLTTGCANMVTTASSTPAGAASSLAVSGQVKGGNQPVSAATVQLYEVGQSGVGSSPTLLATTTTDQYGSFQFTKMDGNTVYPNTGNTYSCPTDYGNQGLLYLISRGGNTIGDGSASRNTAAVFLAPLGYCGSLTSATQVTISEVTTAAMVAAIGQFINPSTEGIGNDGIGTAYTAIGSSFALIANLVSPSSGLANTTITRSATSSSTNSASVTVTGTPQSAKLNTIANILSSCINQATATSANNCSTLFANAVPPPFPSRTSQPSATFPTATDTLQAALYMAINPTDSNSTNRQNLYNLSPASGAPFQPTSTTLPTDWTIAIGYTATGNCSNGAPFFSGPRDLSVDPAGAVWIANTAASQGAMAQISPTGVPLNCQGPSTGSFASSVIDTAGNLWYGDANSNRLYRYSTSGATLTYTTAFPVMSLAADGAGAVFFTATDGTTGYVYKVTNAAYTSSVNSPSLISNTVGTLPSRIFPDNAGDLFVTSGQGFITEVAAGSGGQNYVGGYTSTPLSATTPTYGVVAGPQNRIYVTSRDPGNTLTVFAPSGATYALQPGFPTAANTGGLNNPAGIWIDGAQNSWVANSAAETATGNWAISAISLDGTSISGSGSANGGYQKSTVYLNSPRQTAVDASGNVWVTNDNSALVTEIVGAAVPIYAPYAVGLRVGRFQTIP